MTIATQQTSAAPKIESRDLTLEDLFKDFYSVPDFQREYVWEWENVETLLEDVYDEFYDADARLIQGPEYFVGSIVTCRNAEGTYELIDGQQRLTTIFLMLCVIRDRLIEIGQPVPSYLGDCIQANAMTASGDNEPRYRLALQYEDSHQVLEVIASRSMALADVKDLTESIENIKAAYTAARSFLLGKFEDDPQKVKAFLAAFLRRVKLILIITPNLSHALKVFETINDRGVGLNAMDLLKNLLFIKTSPAKHRKLKGRWEDLVKTLNRAKEKPLRFLRYFVMSHFDDEWARPLREDEIYKWFVDHSDQCGIDRDPIAFVEELVECAEAHAEFLKGKNLDGSWNNYLLNCTSVAGRAARQHFILLLAARHLSVPLFSELCRHIERLLFCYTLTRESTKTFERNFARWSADLRRIRTEEQLRAFLEARLHAELNAREKDFDFAFRELTESRIQRYKLKYILAKLTQYIERQAWGNAADEDLSKYIDTSVEVEHILPQRPADGVREAFDILGSYDDQVERLGNLTLLEKTINCSVSNGPFAAKRPGYAESGFLLTRSIAVKPQVGQNTALNRAVKDLIQFQNWTSIDIQRRHDMLTTLAHDIWMRNAE